MNMKILLQQLVLYCLINERKRIKISKYPKLEDAMSQWFKQASVFQNVIIEKAEKYANFLGYQELKGSSGWLDGFKKEII